MTKIYSKLQRIKKTKNCFHRKKVIKELWLKNLEMISLFSKILQYNTIKIKILKNLRIHMNNSRKNKIHRIKILKRKKQNLF